MTCPKCNSKKEPMLCTATVDGQAAIDQNDPDHSDVYVTVDTGISVWLHVCRDCRHIMDAGIEDKGVLTDVSAMRAAFYRTPVDHQQAEA